MALATPALTAPATSSAVSSHSLGLASSLGLALLTSRFGDFLGNMLVLGDILRLRVRHGSSDILWDLGRTGLYMGLLLLLGVWDLGSDIASRVGRDDDWLGDALGRIASALVWNSSVDCDMPCLGDMDSIWIAVSLRSSNYKVSFRR